MARPAASQLSMPARLVRAVDQRWSAILAGLAGATVAVVVADCLLAASLRELNWIYLTGYAAAWFVLFRSAELPRRITALRHSLIRQGILETCEVVDGRLVPVDRESALDRLADAMERRVLERTARVTLAFAALATPMVVLFGIHRPLEGSGLVAWLHRAEYGLGLVYVVLLCLRFGRALGFSLVMWTYRSITLHQDGRTYGVHPRPQPGHADRHCGFRIVNEFWSFEVGLLVPMLVYTLGWLGLAGWGGLLRVFPEFYWTYETLSGGRPLDVFLALSALLVGLQLVALWVPVVALRIVMGRTREELREDADRVAFDVRSLKEKLLDPETPAERKKELADELGFALEAYRDHEDMPLWPISGRTFWRHVLHLWSLVAFLGIYTAEDLHARTLDLLAVREPSAGVPVRLAVRNDTSGPVEFVYLGPERCWERGTLPLRPVAVAAGERSRVHESRALTGGCGAAGLDAYFWLWLRWDGAAGGEGAVPRASGPVLIAASSECAVEAEATCLRVLDGPRALAVSVDHAGSAGAWQLRIAP